MAEAEGSCKEGYTAVAEGRPEKLEDVDGYLVAISGSKGASSEKCILYLFANSEGDCSSLP
jgi:hypothetical protein